MILGVAAVGVPAGGAEIGAEVLVAGSRQTRSAAGGMDPGHPDPLARRQAARPLAAGRHPADHLVAEDDRQARRGRPPLDLVQLGVADAAGGHADEDLSGAGNGLGQLGRLQGARVVPELSEAAKDHRSHRGGLTNGSVR